MKSAIKPILIVGVFLLAATAKVLAADLPQPAMVPYYPPIPAYNWTGFYVGGSLGGGRSQGGFSDAFGNNFGANNNAVFIGGGQIGADYEFYNQVVVGIEADFDWVPNTNNTSGAVFIPQVGAPVTVTNNNSWLSTLTGRLGYAFNCWLIYAKGGGAWFGSSNPTFNNVTTGASISPGTSNNNWGWTAGVGVEWAFSDNWSARLEYDYIGLNSQTMAVPTGSPFLGGDQITSNGRSLQMVSVGVNYKFWGY